MSLSCLLEVLDFNRQKTLAFLDTLAKQENVAEALAFRPGPARAHLAWQLMHLGATDDRHVHVRMSVGQPKQPDYVRRFAGGSTPDEQIPTLDEIRSYLDSQRQEVLAYARKLDDKSLAAKPHEQAPWTHQEWLKVLAWHEAHHQGQAHLTLNLYRATHGLK